MTSEQNAQSQRLKVAVVIPTYNEAENLPVVIDKILALDIDGLGFVIVDDGSPDGTGELAEKIASEFDGVFSVVHRESKSGLGGAYVAGFGRAIELGAERIVQMDADMSHPVNLVPQMVEMLDDHDVVVGSRYVEGGGVDPGWNFIRKQISFWGGFGIRMVLGLKVKDTTSGFKAFRRESLETIGLDRLKLSGFGFQSEVAYRCQQAGLSVGEMPFVFMDRTVGKSKMSIGIMVEAFYRLVMLRIRG